MSNPRVPLQKTARLHEKTVQAVARGEVPKRPRRPRKPQQYISVARIGEPYTGVVDERVIVAAKRIIANGTYSHWTALGPREVLVS